MAFEPFNLGQIVGNVEEIQGSRARNALFQRQLAQAEEELKRNALIREAQAGALGGDQNALAQLQTLDPAGSLDFASKLTSRELESLELLNRAATAVTQSQSPAVMARFHLQSPALKRAAQVIGFDVDAALKGDMSDEAVKAGAQQLAEITRSMLAPEQDEGFTLGPGQTRFNALGQPIASVEPPAPELGEAEKLLMQDALARARDAEGRAFTASENARTREAKVEEREAKRAEKLIDESRKKAEALATYEAARSALLSGLENTSTGPIVGRIPALTSAQQIAEGGVASMAPILKQLFRTAGEGTFTDRDQALLLDMVPKRTDHPEAREAKIAAIDAIVRAKLGGGSPEFAGGGEAGVINWEDLP
jgi:hypothetical protein